MAFPIDSNNLGVSELLSHTLRIRRVSSSAGPPPSSTALSPFAVPAHTEPLHHRPSNADMTLTNELFRQILTRKAHLEFMPYPCPRCRWKRRVGGKVAYLQISKTKAFLKCSNKECLFPLLPTPGVAKVPSEKLFFDRRIDVDWIPQTTADIYGSEALVQLLGDTRKPVVQLEDNSESATASLNTPPPVHTISNPNLSSLSTPHFPYDTEKQTEKVSEKRKLDCIVEDSLKPRICVPDRPSSLLNLLSYHVPALPSPSQPHFPNIPSPLRNSVTARASQETFTSQMMSPLRFDNNSNLSDKNIEDFAHSNHDHLDSQGEDPLVPLGGGGGNSLLEPDSSFGDLNSSFPLQSPHLLDTPQKESPARVGYRKSLKVAPTKTAQQKLLQKPPSVAQNSQQDTTRLCDQVKDVETTVESKTKPKHQTSIFPQRQRRTVSKVDRKSQSSAEEEEVGLPLASTKTIQPRTIVAELPGKPVVEQQPVSSGAFFLEALSQLDPTPPSPVRCSEKRKFKSRSPASSVSMSDVSSHRRTRSQGLSELSSMADLEEAKQPSRQRIRRETIDTVDGATQEGPSEAQNTQGTVPEVVMTPPRKGTKRPLEQVSKIQAETDTKLADTSMSPAHLPQQKVSSPSLCLDLNSVSENGGSKQHSLTLEHSEQSRDISATGSGVGAETEIGDKLCSENEDESNALDPGMKTNWAKLRTKKISRFGSQGTRFETDKRTPTNSWKRHKTDTEKEEATPKLLNLNDMQRQTLLMLTQKVRVRDTRPTPTPKNRGRRLRTPQQVPAQLPNGSSPRTGVAPPIEISSPRLAQSEAVASQLIATTDSYETLNGRKVKSVTQTHQSPSSKLTGIHSTILPKEAVRVSGSKFPVSPLMLRTVDSSSSDWSLRLDDSYDSVDNKSNKNAVDLRGLSRVIEGALNQSSIPSHAPASPLISKHPVVAAVGPNNPRWSNQKQAVSPQNTGGRKFSGYASNPKSGRGMIEGSSNPPPLSIPSRPLAVLPMAGIGQPKSGLSSPEDARSLGSNPHPNAVQTQRIKTKDQLVKEQLEKQKMAKIMELRNAALQRSTFMASPGTTPIPPPSTPAAYSYPPNTTYASPMVPYPYSTQSATAGYSQYQPTVTAVAPVTVMDQSDPFQAAIGNTHQYSGYDVHVVDHQQTAPHEHAGYAGLEHQDPFSMDTYYATMAYQGYHHEDEGTLEDYFE